MKATKPFVNFWQGTLPWFLPHPPPKLFLVLHIMNIIWASLYLLTIPGGAALLEPSPGYIKECKLFRDYN